MYMCIYWYYLEILWIYRKFLFFTLYWLLLNHKDGKIWRIWFNYGIGCKHAGFHSLRPMGSNLMNEHNFKQLLVLEVCHWPWANIYHEHNLSSWYGKGILMQNFPWSCNVCGSPWFLVNFLLSPEGRASFYDTTGASN